MGRAGKRLLRASASELDAPSASIRVSLCDEPSRTSRASLGDDVQRAVAGEQRMVGEAHDFVGGHADGESQELLEAADAAEAVEDVANGADTGDAADFRFERASTKGGAEGEVVRVEETFGVAALAGAE